MNNFVTWDVDPVLVYIGDMQLRYYGIFFAATILVGFYLMRRLLRMYGFKDKVADDFLIWGVLGVVVGARLVHCFFYEPAYYLNNPGEIIKVWKGGVASHGATIGLLTVIFIFIRKHKMRFFELGDGVVFAAAVGATFVRFGNLFNSEIVGRVTDASWGWKFLRFVPDHEQAMINAANACGYDDIACLVPYWPVRYPSQLIEALGGFIILMILIAVSVYCRKKNIRKPGLYSGIFITLYFTFRFFVEFIKEYQTLKEGFTMGQYLSIPFVIFGIIVFCSLFRKQAEPNIVPEAASDGKHRSKKK